jgi:hypothetical protein
VCQCSWQYRSKGSQHKHRCLRKTAAGAPATAAAQGSFSTQLLVQAAAERGPPGDWVTLQATHICPKQKTGCTEGKEPETFDLNSPTHPSASSL